MRPQAYSFLMPVIIIYTVAECPGKRLSTILGLRRLSVVTMCKNLMDSESKPTPKFIVSTTLYAKY